MLGQNGFWKGLVLGAVIGLTIRMPKGKEMRRALDFNKAAHQVARLSVPVDVTSSTISAMLPACNLHSTSMIIGHPGMTDRVIQALVLSPQHPGLLVAIVNVMNLDCTKRAMYISTTNPVVSVLVDDTKQTWIPNIVPLGTKAQKLGTWVKRMHTTMEFRIPVDRFQEFINNERRNRETKKEQAAGKIPCQDQHVLVKDLIAGRTYAIPLVIDSTIFALEQQAKNDNNGIGSRNDFPHNFLGGLVWINKSRRFYLGRRGDLSVKTGGGRPHLTEEEGERNGPMPRNDNYTMAYLLPWINHHHSLGVQRIYVLDQDNDLSVANIKSIEELDYVTYIRAPYAHMDFYVDTCIDGRVVGHSRHSTMQHILDTIVLRMTPIQYMWVSDVDEFVIPAGYNSSLPALVQDFSTKKCMGLRQKQIMPKWAEWNKITCAKTNDTVFELRFYQGKIDTNDTMKLATDKDDIWALTKCIYRAADTARSIVHLAYPRFELTRKKTSTLVLPSQGFMAHYRGSAPTKKMLEDAALHAKELAHLELNSSKPNV
jgi:Glycosyltransferase family 92